MTRPERTKHAVRATISFLLHFLGVLGLWQFIALRKKAVVLTYHRVLTSAERDNCGSHPAIVVDRDTFAKQMEVLRRRFTVLSLDEFADHVARGIPFPSSSCLVTFDDGWRDNRTNALPVLEESGCPAVIFLPVNYIGRQRAFWRESLTQLLVMVVLEVRKSPSRDTQFRQVLHPFGLEWLLGLSDPDPRPRVIETIHSSLPTSTAERLVQLLLETLEIGIQDISANDGFLNWEDVDAMARAGITFGSHGTEHRRLTDLALDEARLEIAASKKVLMERFPDAVAAFSYPNGCLNPDIAGMARQAGYRLAFTTEPGFVHCDDDPLTLKRVNIHQGMTDTIPMFLARVLGLW